MNTELPETKLFTTARQFRIDELCDQFEAAWQSGALPSIEDYLKQIDAAGRSELLQELVILDLGYRWDRAGKDQEKENDPPEGCQSIHGLPLRALLDDYLAAFPELGPLEQLPLEVIREELNVRGQFADASSHADCEARFALHPELSAILQGSDATKPSGASTPAARQKSGFQIRCPHCHNPIAIVADTPVTDILCAGCGNQFSLVNDDFESTEAESLGMLGHFELIERIGVGGFATVWKAHDRELERTVAVKIPRKGELTASEAEKFLREARVVAQIHHPNVMSVHEVGRHDDIYYIITDLVSGSTLAQWRLDRQPTTEEAVDLCAKIADGLHHAHESGVIHRDLKPQNVMVDDQDEPHIMDFGLAKRDAGETTVTVDGIVLGTPAYMSPEQARGEGHQADRRTDIYALGVILYELLAGALPFRGNSRSLMDQVIHDLPPSPRKLNGTLPRDLETICLKCLEKNPRSRYATAAELAAELRRYSRGEPLVARPLSGVARTWRWCRRQPLVATLCAAIATLLLLIAIGGPMVALHERSLRQLADQHSLRANAGEEVARKHEQEARDQLYFSDMNLVARFWELNNLWRMRELLERHRPQPGERDLRQFEWFYYWRLCHSELMTLQHPRPVTAAAFSPDGNVLAVCDYGSTVSLYDWKQARVTNILEGHDGSIRVLAFSPDGKTLASGGSDHAVHLWQVPEGTALAKLEGHSSDIVSLAFSTDSKTLASAGREDATVRLWDVDRGQQTALLTEHSSGVEAVTFSPAGTTLATGSRDHTIILWDYVKGKRTKRLQGHHACVFSLAFSQDGNKLVSGGADYAVKFWDLEVGTETASLPGTNFIRAVAFSPDGACVASGGMDHTVRVWDAKTGAEMATLRGHERGINTVAFSPAGILASASEDGTVRLWDTAELKRQTLRGHTAAIHAVTYSPDGGLAASGGSDRTVKLWETSTGQVTDTLTGHQALVADVAFAPEGIELASASYDGTVKLWDAMTGKERLSLKGHTKGVTSVMYSPDGMILASGSIDRTVRLWDATTGALRATCVGHEAAVFDVAFSPDGLQLASCSADGKILLWDSASGERGRELLGHTTVVWSVDFSPNGKTLASASHDETMILWDLDRAAPIQTMRGHGNVIQSVDFSPDGGTLASGSWDQTVGLWDVQSGQLRATFKTELGRITMVAFSPDGNRLIASGHAPTLQTFRADPIALAAP